MTGIASIAKYLRAMALLLVFTTAFAPWGYAETAEKSLFKPEELEQIVAPIALYPDPLLAQVLMASTYPLEVVQAERWQKQNKELKGDGLKAALDKQPWDASVKSLVNFPDVLSMLSDKLDWTQKLGDAFLAQQKEVMDTVQTLRKKAEAEGNLESTKEQTVTVQEEKIAIEPADPQVVYVPVYNPTVVYGVWPYPAYPPYYYYPPAYVYPPGGLFISFGVGMAMGAAWGHYAHGGCNWHSGDIDIDINRNTNINRGGDRVTHNSGGQGQKWQHNPEHRQGVAYRDQATGQKYNRASTRDSVQSRENYRGHADQGRQDLARGGADNHKGRSDAARPSTTENRSAGRDASSQRSDTFSGMDHGGSTTRDNSSRGSASRQSMSSGSRGGYSGGGSRGGGGGRGGGGRR
ncbi:MAG: DUF3300 domain-containing protein [Desulfobacterales bacterium]|nr:DUF3300 domain-containing protein [Desulfobacterales bacterium]